MCYLMALEWLDAVFEAMQEARWINKSLLTPLCSRLKQSLGALLKPSFLWECFPVQAEGEKKMEF